MQSIQQSIADHFARYRSTDVVYQSGDQLFLTHAAALSYGKGEVKTIRRGDLSSERPKQPLNAVQTTRNSKPRRRTSGSRSGTIKKQP